MTNEIDNRPFIVLTAILDAGARQAAVTVSHADGMERAIAALGAQPIAGLEIVELPVAPAVFSALRGAVRGGNQMVAVYDLFPLSAGLDSRYRTIAGQFLASEALWILEEQGALRGAPLNLKLKLPRGWDKDPRMIHEKLLAAGALNLGPEAIESYRTIKTAWDASA